MKKEKNYWEVVLPFHQERNKEMINQFLSYLKDNASITTVKSYKCYLQIFFQFQERLFSDFTREEIVTWVQDNFDISNEKQLKNRIAGISSFYTYCEEVGQLEKSPFKSDKIERIHQVSNLPNKQNEQIINAYLLKKKEKHPYATMQGTYEELQRIFKVIEIDLHLLNTKDIENYFFSYQTTRKKSTVDKTYSVLNLFFNYCVVKGYMRENLCFSERKVWWHLKKNIKNQENQKIINEFLLYTKNYKSKNIVIDYRMNLQLFFQSLEKSYKVLTREEILYHLHELEFQVKYSIIKKIKTAISYFYRYCLHQGYIDKNPVVNELRKDKKYYWI